MAKRSHSDSHLGDPSQAAEDVNVAKKQRVEDIEQEVSGNVKKEKKSKDRKKEKSLAKAENGNQVSVNGDQAPEAIKEKKRKRKEREAAIEVTEAIAPNGSSAALIKVDEVAEAATDEVDTLGEAKKKEKNSKKDRKSKSEKKDVATTSGSDDSVALSGELAQPTTKAPVTQDVAASGTYTEDQALTALPQTEIDTFLNTNFIAISDPLAQAQPTYRPITDFKYLPGYDAQREIFKTFKTPSPIQAAAWPFLLAGRDAVGVAETGSGKTLAFGLPCIRYVTSEASRKRKGGSNVKAVVVSPTRELALQIYEQFTKIAAGTKVKVVCIYGGVPKDEQRNALRTASIIVATPGRLNDFLQEGAADLTNVGYVVLDEADRMLDKGFEDEIRKIISTVPTSTCQTLMFTATWPQSIRELAATFMKNPVKITIGDNPTGDLRANVRVTQLVEVVDPRGKEMRLLQLLKQYQSGKNKNDRILVFCLYKKEATRIENFIRMKGFKVAGIHGDLGQSQRTASLEAFKSGAVPLLVATDVAARGLDIPSVMLVINVTFPLTAEDYVHRIGRTGRAGKDGLAITLFTEHDKALSGGLINVLKAAKQEVPPELLKFGTTVKKKAHEAYGNFYKDTTGEEKKASKITFD